MSLNRYGQGNSPPSTNWSSRHQTPYSQSVSSGMPQQSTNLGSNNFPAVPVYPPNVPQPTNSYRQTVQNVMQPIVNAFDATKRYLYSMQGSQSSNSQHGSSGFYTNDPITPTPVVSPDPYGIRGSNSSQKYSTNELPYSGQHQTPYTTRTQALQPLPYQQYGYPNTQPAQGNTYPYSSGNQYPGTAYNEEAPYTTTGPYYEPPRINPEQKKLMDEMEEMRKNQEKADRDREEKMRKRREERERKDKLVEEQMDRDQKEQIKLDELRKQDSELRVERETERLKRENELEAKRQEQFYQEEMISLKRAGEREREDIQEQRQREQVEFDRIVAEQDQKFEEKTVEYQNEEEMRRTELLRIQEEHEDRVRQIYEELERRREEFRHQHEEKMNQMKKQWEQIQQMLKYKVWNEVIERCWTNRLNVLRNANRKVAELFHRFYKEGKKIQKRLDNSEEVTREIQRVVPVLNALLEAVKLQANLMNEESENLEIQWQYTEKNFVLGIQAAVNTVKQACELSESTMKNYKNLVKNESTLSLHEHQLEETKMCFDNLSKCSAEIPTLAELKRNFSDDMRNEASSNNHQEVVPFEQSVIIEEIE